MNCIVRLRFPSRFSSAIFSLSTALSLAFLVSGCTSKQKEALGIDLKLDQRTLSNGLKVIMIADTKTPVITYQTWFRVGSVDETPGMTGISHLFEHLMFKGTPKYPAKQFFQQLEAKGAEVNAFTTRDYTVYFENFTPQLLDKVIDMESDRLENLTLTDEVLDSERMVVLEERRLRTDSSPAAKIQEALWGLAYRRHPYQWPVIGFPEDLARLKLPQVIEYFKSHYQPANAVLVVVGAIDPDQTFEKIKKAYEKIPARERPKRNIPNEPEQKEEHRLVLHDHVATQRFAQAYHVTAADDDDSYALDVLANILFEGVSSRAYQRLVEEKDLLSSVSGSAYTPTYPGLFIISGVLKGGASLADAETELDKLIRETQEKEVSKEEIQAAVRQLTVQLVDGVRTPYGMGQLVGTVATVFGDPERFSEDLAKYLKVTSADVKKMANKYLVPNNRSIVTMLPEANSPKGASQGGEE